MSERKLVTIRVIKDISPIKGADLIEVVTIDGWKVVIKKGEFKIGDKCVYFEIDSFLPVREEFEFLRKGCYKKFANGVEGFRLRTIKLRGQVSQGLALPLKALKIKENTKVGSDLTTKLKVLKYEPEVLGQSHLQRSWIVRRLQQLKWTLLSFLPFGKKYKTPSPKSFPSFLRKTDEERIQNLDITKFKGNTYEVTEKLDGTSTTIFYNNGDFGVCSRNRQVTYVESEGLTGAYWEVTIKHDLEKKLKELGRNIAIQGEAVGPAIQGNKYQLDNKDLFVYKIWDIDNQKYLGSEERISLTKQLGLKHVPVLDTIVFDFDLDGLLSFAEGKSVINKKTEREGIVFKAIDGTHSFKVISNKFLLKFE